MGRVNTPPARENPNNGFPGQPTGSPIKQDRVPMRQSAPPNYHQANVNLSIGTPWSTNLFDCQKDQTNAVMTVIFPCMTFGQISEVVDEGEMSCPLGTFIYLLMIQTLCLQAVMGSKYRGKMRRKFNLVEAPYSDCITHLFCPWCALCQEFRELKARNLDPSLGWNGILAQTQGQYETEAPPNQYMSK